MRSSTSADGAPPRPCSSHVYQVTLTLARCATSSRRRPGVRRRVAGRPSASGLTLARRARKYVPSAVPLAVASVMLLVAIPLYRLVFTATVHRSITGDGGLVHACVRDRS